MSKPRREKALSYLAQYGILTWDATYELNNDQIQHFGRFFDNSSSK